MVAAGPILTGATAPLAEAMAVVVVWAVTGRGLAGHRVTGATVRHAGPGARRAG